MSDLFSVFDDDNDQPQKKNENVDSPAPSKVLTALKRKNFTQETEQPLKKHMPEVPKPLVVEVAENNAKIQKKKEALDNEEPLVTLVECIHEIAYPPDWR